MALPDMKQYLKPMRNLWEGPTLPLDNPVFVAPLGITNSPCSTTPPPAWFAGTEGIAWLAAAPITELEAGAFYLDRSVVTQHVRVEGHADLLKY